MPTNAQRVKSAMTALKGRTAFLRFYQKMSDSAYTSVLRSWIHHRIIWIEYSKLCYCDFCTRDNLLNIFIVQNHKDLLICFLVQNYFKFCMCIISRLLFQYLWIHLYVCANWNTNLRLWRSFYLQSYSIKVRCI